MNAGELDRIVKLQRYSSVLNIIGGEYLKTAAGENLKTATGDQLVQAILSIYDIYGEETKAWSDIATIWAKRKDLKGTERWLANQDLAKVTCIYVTRYRSDVTPLCRLIDADGRTYNITAAVEVGRREGLWLYVEARVDTPVENPPIP